MADCRGGLVLQGPPAKANSQTEDPCSGAGDILRVGRGKQFQDEHTRK
jgi:hypothetical protein